MNYFFLLKLKAKLPFSSLQLSITFLHDAASKAKSSFLLRKLNTKYHF